MFIRGIDDVVGCWRDRLQYKKDHRRPLTGELPFKGASEFECNFNLFVVSCGHSLTRSSLRTGRSVLAVITTCCGNDVVVHGEVSSLNFLSAARDPCVSLYDPAAL